MTARKLEEFINLIETAEKISNNDPIPQLNLPRYEYTIYIFYIILICTYLKVTKIFSISDHQCFTATILNKSNHLLHAANLVLLNHLQFRVSEFHQLHPAPLHTGRSNLSLQCRIYLSHQMFRFVGPAASHCGLTLSDITTPSKLNVEAGSVVTTERSAVVPQISIPQSTPVTSSVAASSRTSETSSTISTTVKPPPESVSSQPSEVIINLQKNAPFVRRISQDCLPASPDR